MVAAAAAVCLISAVSASPFRFMGGEGDRSDLFGEAGLNAVPRLGRRSPANNPFDANSRFRFRFHGPSSSWFGSRLGNAAFRFQGDEAAPNQYFQLRKRLFESIKAKRADQEPAEVEAAPVGNEEPQALDNGQIDLEKFQLANAYWNRYLEELERNQRFNKLRPGMF